MEDKLDLSLDALDEYENEFNKVKFKATKIFIIANNFITWIEYLNKIKKEHNNQINKSTKVCEIETFKNKKYISKDFKDIFRIDKD